MSGSHRRLTILLGILAVGSPLQATVISFDVVGVVGNTFEYHYTVENDTLGAPLEEFAVYFDHTLFENLRLPVAPATWDPLVVEPDAVLLDDGFYDGLAFGIGIPSGGILGGFSVVVDFLGPGSPGSQRFEVLDPVSFLVLDRGVTTPAAALVSEPTTLYIMSLGLLSLGAIARRRRRA